MPIKAAAGTSASVRLLSSLVNCGPHIVCWGAAAPSGLNSCQKVLGVTQLERLSEAGLHVPAHTRSLATAREWAEAGLPVWGRINTHTRGRDIVGQRHPRWLRSDYWVVFQPALQEWRIHSFLGKSIARGLKVQAGPATRRLLVRSRSNGWRMRHDLDPPKGLRPLAAKAVAALGYDFGAVDILQLTEPDAKGRVRGMVLEVNSAPGLSNYTAQAYARAIRQWIEREQQ